MEENEESHILLKDGLEDNQEEHDQLRLNKVIDL